MIALLRRFKLSITATLAFAVLFLVLPTPASAQFGGVIIAPSSLGGAGPSGIYSTVVALTSTLAATVFPVKTTAGNLYSVSYYNGSAAACYIQLFNATVANVNLGTTAAVDWIPMAPTSASGPNVNSPIPLRYYNTAMSAASTTTPTGATPCATVTVAVFRYK